MFQQAIARTPCSNMIHGLTTANLGQPNYNLAIQQHNQYLSVLKQCGVNLTLLPAEERFPDSVFVEDTVLCTSHCAILTRPGADSRRGEVDLMVSVLENFFENIEAIKSPGTLDAGDVMMVGSHFYIGLSARTNEIGAQQLMAILKKYGLTSSTVQMEQGLHLKSSMSYLENNNLLSVAGFAQPADYLQLNIITIPEQEAYAANCIWVNDFVLMPAGFPVTHTKISELGYNVLEVDVSEFRKLDGGLSCLSLRF